MNALAPRTKLRAASIAEKLTGMDAEPNPMQLIGAMNQMGMDPMDPMVRAVSMDPMRQILGGKS